VPLEGGRLVATARAPNLFQSHLFTVWNTSASKLRSQLVKYPPQFKIGFLSNNPPVYDVLPRVREMMVSVGRRPRGLVPKSSKDGMVGSPRGKS
jgi:hypothetical protein